VTGKITPYHCSKAESYEITRQANPSGVLKEVVMQRMEEDFMEDLFYDEAEGAAEFGEEEWEGYEAADEADFGEEEEWEGADEAYMEGYEDEGFDEYEDYGEGFDDYDSAMEDAMAYALGAEDSDEFLGGIWKGIKKVGRVVGKVARVAAPIARLIPHPYAQLAAKGLGLIGKLRAEGASEDEALDAFAELASYDESALPIVAGLAARKLVKRRGAHLPLPARRHLVRTMHHAAKTLVHQRGPKAIRALPKVVSSVKRTAAVKGTPIKVMPKVVARTVNKVVKSKPLVKKLSKPVPTATRVVRAVMGHLLPGALGYPGPMAHPGHMASPWMGKKRSFVLQGPVRITIHGS
jgi:hypothetical protein